MIIFSLSTIYKRKENLSTIIPNILEQCDVLHINLIGYDENPHFNSSKIIYHSLPTGTGAESKFNHYLECNSSDYYLTIDDDILYPKNYVDKIIRKGELITCLHGGFWNLSVSKNFRKYRKTYNFKDELKKDTEVHFGGTGTMCIKGELLDIPKNYFKHKNMVDPYLSVLANKQKVPIVSVKREKNWLKDLNDFGEKINGNNPNLEIDKLIKENKHYFKPLKKKI